MFIKALSAALMGLALSSAAPVPVEIELGAIIPLSCGRAQGTAFHIGGGRYVTAAHVTAFAGEGSCSFRFIQLQVVRQDGSLDLAELSGFPLRNEAGGEVRLEIECRGYRPGRTYRSFGYAGGFFSMFPLIASRHLLAGQRVFIGADIVPGMSGGPVVSDDSGRVTGINNQRWPSRSRDLRGTWLCEGRS
jgi:hypothetical protein